MPKVEVKVQMFNERLLMPTNNLGNHYITGINRLIFHRRVREAANVLFRVKTEITPR